MAARMHRLVLAALGTTSQLNMLAEAVTASGGRNRITKSRIILGLLAHGLGIPYLTRHFVHLLTHLTKPLLS